jgi:sec-independent protein translocase protein TatA
MLPLAIGGLGTPELLLILAVVVLLFGASKLPDLARGSGRALRIFKAETKGLMDDDEDDEKKPRAGSDAATSQAQLELEAKQADLAQRQAELDAERERLQRNDGA